MRLIISCNTFSIQEQNRKKLRKAHNPNNRSKPLKEVKDKATWLSNPIKKGPVLAGPYSRKFNLKYMDFIKLSDQLPPANTIVMVKRKKGKTYLGFRRVDKPLATNPDSSQDIYWRGVPIDDLAAYDYNGAFCKSSFSDVTVESWAHLSV